MSWTFADARRAVLALRGADRHREAVGTVRPRDGGLTRSRAPLSLLLYVAARDGLVVGEPGGAFAVLQPPLSDRSAARSGVRGPEGVRMRALRLLDRHWEYAVLAGPPLLAMLVAVALVPFAGSRPASLVLVALGTAWVCLLLTTRLATQLGWVARMGAATGPRHRRAAASWPGHAWWVPLLHQPDPEPGPVDQLVRDLLTRHHRLLRARARAALGGQGDAEVAVTAPLVVLVSGVTTERARTALARSQRTTREHATDEDVLVLRPADQPREVPPRAVAGGGFLLLYLAAVAVVVAVLAAYVSGIEAAACAAACAGRPATYGEAIRWLLQRLLFTDPAGLAPGTLRASVLGWLVSFLTPVGVLVAAVAIKQEIRQNQQTGQRYDDTMEALVDEARLLVLVVTDRERKATMEAMRSLTGVDPVLESRGRRTAFRLGSAGGCEILLAQAGEQGTGAAAGTMVSALHLIGQLKPRYVVLTGICYGLRPSEGHRIGDVIVARRVQGVDHKKVTPERIVERGKNVGASPYLLDRFQAAAATWTGGAPVHVGTLLTSNTVVDSLELVEELRLRFPDAIGGEMEGSGVYEATTEEIKPDWIVVKAISDWGQDKDDTGQPLAARNAAEFVAHVVASGILARA